jgi:hypothetical protein
MSSAVTTSASKDATDAKASKDAKSAKQVTVSFSTLGPVCVGFDGKVPMIALKKPYVLPSQIAVDSETTWGQLFQTLITDQPDYETHILSNRYVAEDGDLCERLSAKVGADTEVAVLLLAPEIYHLRLAYSAWSTGQKWPPCDNWGEEEPITHLLVGRALPEEHHCPSCEGEYNRQHDNGLQNMIVLKYPNGGHRIGYNKWALLAWLAQQLQNGQRPTEPRSRIRISKAIIEKIVLASNYELVEL